MNNIIAQKVNFIETFPMQTLCTKAEKINYAKSDLYRKKKLAVPYKNCMEVRIFLLLNLVAGGGQQTNIVCIKATLTLVRFWGTHCHKLDRAKGQITRKLA